MAFQENDQSQQRLKSLRVVLAGSVIVALVAGFFGGTWYAKHTVVTTTDSVIRTVVNPDQPASSTSSVDFGLFWQVWDKLHANFVDQKTLDAQKLLYGAISGMVSAAGDPYTAFFEPVTSKQFQEQVQGAFSGVGMEIGLKNNHITVIAPIKNSPAQKAGIETGDVITKIDGTSTATLTVDAAVTLIRGKEGTQVHLTVMRASQVAPLDFTLTRENIKIPAVDWKMLANHVAYVQIYSFNANVADEFATAAKELQQQGATSLIIDLRDDPGGLLDQAVDIAGWMLDPGSVVVQERYADASVDQLKAQGNAALKNLPTVIIMNGGSASASEILAGALHDDRAIALIGEQSFGKGSVQQLIDFYNGSSLKVTVAKWLTPKGVSISQTGITPTDPLKMDPTDPAAKNWEVGTPGKDPQLDEAVKDVSAMVK